MGVAAPGVSAESLLSCPTSEMTFLAWVGVRPEYRLKFYRHN